MLESNTEQIISFFVLIVIYCLILGFLSAIPHSHIHFRYLSYTPMIYKTWDNLKFHISYKQIEKMHKNNINDLLLTVSERINPFRRNYHPTPLLTVLIFSVCNCRPPFISKWVKILVALNNSINNEKNTITK